MATEMKSAEVTLTVQLHVAGIVLQLWTYLNYEGGLYIYTFFFSLQLLQQVRGQ